MTYFSPSKKPIFVILVMTPLLLFMMIAQKLFMSYPPVVSTIVKLKYYQGLI